MADSTPIVTISRRGAARLRAGHLWVYRSDIVGDGATPRGSLVRIQDERGRSLGSALSSSSSQIAIRMLSSEAIGEAALPDLLRGRILAAIEFRRQRVRDSDAWRVIFSESDLLPGLIVDRYNDVLTVQAVTQAFDREDLRQAVLDCLAQQFPDASIVERVDPHIRELEQLAERSSQMLRVPGASSHSSRVGREKADHSSTIFTLNGVSFHFDAFAGQKTGAFLDQRENYAAAARYAHGQALDVFTYQGGFALHLARVCEAVGGVDSSRPALEVAEQNELLNREQHRSGEIEWIEANAFDLLKDYAAAQREYDTIVLDPPAFAKTKRAVPTALSGYKELNLRALKMLRPGGVLVTCSCSFHVSKAEFLDMLGSAAADAGRRVRILEKRGAAIDHPVLLNMPETAYLKCIVGQVLA